MYEKQLEKLLNEIKEAYAKSDLKEYCLKNDKEWFYSLLGSKFIENPILLIGLNFGASCDEYKPQTIDNIRDLLPFCQMKNNNLGQSFTRLKKYIGGYDNINIKHITWTNFCFFRSYSNKELTSNDFNLTEPIFEKLLNMSKPQSIICVSKHLYNFLNNKNLLTHKQEKKVKINSKANYTVVKAKLFNYSFFCLPHPNYNANFEGRKECWDFCFEK